MPSSLEHAKRVKDGLRFLQFSAAKDFPDELVIAYFYTCLHMFEACVFDFPKLAGKKHFRNHNDRTIFLSRIRYEYKHPLFEVVSDYQALRELSEYARYLSPAGSEIYNPLVVPRDVEQAKELHAHIRHKLEDIYQKNKAAAPWHK